MPVYEYYGLTADGKDVVGIVDADSPKGARTKLRHRGVFPIEVSQEGPGARIGRWPAWSARWFREQIGLRDVTLLTTCTACHR